jgi:hypothetical protein
MLMYTRDTYGRAAAQHLIKTMSFLLLGMSLLGLLICEVTLPK